MEKIDRAELPYVYGGGHGASGGLDCSGSVSRVLMEARLLDGVQSSDGFWDYGKAGKGKLTVLVKPGHVMLLYRGRAWGTSSSNPGGGPGWFRPSPGYLSDFTRRKPIYHEIKREFKKKRNQRTKAKMAMYPASMRIAARQDRRPYNL